MTDRWSSCLRCPKTGFKILVKILIALEYTFGIPTNLQNFRVHSNIKKKFDAICVQTL